MAEKVKGHDETPALVTDHPFEPRGAWWSLCKHCGLAQASHAETTIDSLEEIKKDHIERYGVVNYATDEVEKRSEDRVQIAYYGEDNPDDE